MINDKRIRQFLSALGFGPKDFLRALTPCRRMQQLRVDSVDPIQRNSILEAFLALPLLHDNLRTASFPYGLSSASDPLLGTLLEKCRFLDTLHLNYTYTDIQAVFNALPLHFLD